MWEGLRTDGNPAEEPHPEEEGGDPLEHKGELYDNLQEGNLREGLDVAIN